MNSKSDNKGDIFKSLEHNPGRGKIRNGGDLRGRVSAIRPKQKPEIMPDKLNIPKTPKDKD